MQSRQLTLCLQRTLSNKLGGHCSFRLAVGSFLALILVHTSWRAGGTLPELLAMQKQHLA